MAVANVADEPQYGGYEYEFADKVPERYLCSIVCRKVLRDPRLLVCCGNHICEACLNSWLRSQGELRQQEDQQQPLCPHCREENFTHVKNLSLRREVDELKIRCTNGEAGCTWEGALSDLKTHLESEKGCGYIEVHCTNECKKQLLHKDLTDHLAQHCPLRKYKCQHCGQEDTYQTITEEHYDECHSYPLDCPNECGEKGIKRAEMDQHRSECPLEPVECPFKEAGCQEKLVRRDLDSHVTTNQQQHLLTLMAAFREVKAEFSAAKEATKVMQKLIATDVAIIQQSDGTRSSALALASIKSQLEINSFRLQFDDPPLTIRMINFSYYLRSGKVWHSHPFYCHPGYKMQLAVYANGTGAGASTHVSIALLLMKGELDHQLPWPIEGLVVHPSIVSQKSASEDKLNFVLCPDCIPADRLQRVLEEEDVRELGRTEEFVAHQTVSERLLNDSIILEIHLTDHYSRNLHSSNYESLLSVMFTKTMQ